VTRPSGCHVVGVLALFFFANGCSRAEDSPPTDSVAISLTPAPAPASRPSASSSRDDCPATGQWALCSLEKRLKRSGFVVTRIEGESTRRPGFSVLPAAYKLGKGRLEVFLYDDAALLEKDIAAMDTLAVPGLIRSGNLAAVYMDQNPRQAERLVLAITAGAPSGR
jgi:hypothetical protein